MNVKTRFKDTYSVPAKSVEENKIKTKTAVVQTYANVMNL